MGFKHVGKDVLISEHAKFYGIGNISIGDHSRIDDFCILSAGQEGIDIGCYVHIACYTSIIGKEKVTMQDFSGLSSRCSVFSSSDNYNGRWMTNPCLPAQVMNTYHRPVYLGRHVVVGAGSTILPGVTLNDGCAVGAMSLVNQSWPENIVIAGIPARKIKDRLTNIYELEQLL